jgi:hypothetical protein
MSTPPLADKYPNIESAKDWNRLELEKELKS